MPRATGPCRLPPASRHRYLLLRAKVPGVVVRGLADVAVQVFPCRAEITRVTISEDEYRNTLVAPGHGRWPAVPRIPGRGALYDRLPA